MREQLKLDRQQWREKKLHGSEKQKRAAVSVQVGRIAGKLLSRSGKDNLDFVTEDNYLRKSRVMLDTHEKEKLSLIPGRKKIDRKVEVRNFSMGTLPSDGSSYNKMTTVDPSGKKGASIAEWGRANSSRREWNPYSYGTTNENPTAEEIVEHAAPALYEVKKGTDKAEAEQEKKAA